MLLNKLISLLIIINRVSDSILLQMWDVVIQRVPPGADGSF